MKWLIRLLVKKDKKLGVDQGGGRYDLPLNKAEGFHFLVILIGLMTFLAMMSLCGSFILSAMTERWSSGLENTLTIEIPAESHKEGTLRSSKEIQNLALQVQSTINQIGLAQSSRILSRDEISDLISPWLGDDIAGDTLPLPGLLSVELKPDTDTQLGLLKDEIKKIAPNITLDTHESWLGDLLRFVSALQFSASIIGLVIAVTTVIAVSGAINARMAVHRKEVELLHLMGASDHYIARQFQRHAMVLTLQGALAGTFIGMLVLITINLIGADSTAALVPDFKLKTVHITTLIILPLIACIIGMITARYTVLRALARMP